MSILSSELLLYRSAGVTDVAATNGGRLSANLIGDAVANNIFPEVDEAERTAGSTMYRKVFYKNTNPDTDAGTGLLALSNPQIFMTKETQGDDVITFFQTANEEFDFESALTGSENQYGCGVLTAFNSSTEIEVDVEDAATIIFRDGEKLRISDKLTINGAGNEEIATISGTPTNVGNTFTITLSSALANSYTPASTCKVSSVVEPASSVVSAVDTYVETFTNSGTGTGYDEATYPVETDNIGCVYDDWTLTFTSTTEFTLTAANESIGTVNGNISTNFQPTNAAFGKPYFILYSAGWQAGASGFVIGDTFEFTTHPASTGLWMKRVVPAAATAISGNSFKLGIAGETA